MLRSADFNGAEHHLRWAADLGITSARLLPWAAVLVLWRY